MRVSCVIRGSHPDGVERKKLEHYFDNNICEISPIEGRRMSTNQDQFKKFNKLQAVFDRASI